MRLLSFEITGGEYKNFEQGFKFEHFNVIPENPITVIIGQNGTGKSNLFEILIKIFKSVELKTRVGFEFILKYEIDGKEAIVNGRELSKGTEIRTYYNGESVYQEVFAENYLPKHVFAYYSGDTKRLEKEFDDPKRVFEKELFEQKEGVDLRRLLLVNESHIPLILMTLFLYRDEVGDSILSTLNTGALNEIRLHFNKNPRWYNFSKVDEGNEKFYGAKGIVSDFLDILESVDSGTNMTEKRSSTSGETEYDFYANLIFDGRDFELLKDKFQGPIDFFKYLIATHDSDLIENIEIKFENTYHDKEIEYKQLSEGEKQLVLVLGLIELTRKESTLYLLDEPDTYLNPKWKYEYFDYLKTHLGEVNFENNQLLIATHDPQLVQAASNATVLVFQNNEGQLNVDYEHPDFRGYRVDQILVSELFDLNSARSKDIQHIVQKIKEIISNKEITEKDKKVLKAAENELGYLPTGETIAEIEDRVFLRQKAEEIRNRS